MKSLSCAVDTLIHSEQSFPLKNGGLSIYVCKPTIQDVDTIVSCINVAYVEKEGWFKKDEFKTRTKQTEIETIVQKQLNEAEESNCGFILLRLNVMSHGHDHGDGELQESSSLDLAEQGELIGVVYLDAHGEEEGSLYFGMLACVRKFSNCGFGTTLLNEILPLIAKQAECSYISCKVVNISVPLLTWYMTKCHLEEVGSVEWDECSRHVLKYPAHFKCLRKQVA